MNKFSIAGLIFLIALVFFFRPEPFKCPDEYENAADRSAAFERWTNEFYDRNPDASLSEMAAARRSFYVEHGCAAALERDRAYRSGEIDPETMWQVEDAMNDTRLPR